MKRKTLCRYAAIILLMQFFVLFAIAQNQITVTVQGANKAMPVQFDGSGFSNTAGAKGSGTVTVIKKMDQSSSRLQEYLNGAEKLSTIILKFHKNGTNKVFQTITLTNALLSQISLGKTGRPTETVTFKYEKIEIQAN